MLSRRAHTLVAGQTFNEMWDVIKHGWDKEHNPAGAVNLGVAENHLMRAELDAYLADHIQVAGSTATYDDGPVGSARLRAALADFLSRHLKAATPLQEDQIVVTNGVSSAIEHMAWALADPEEVFLLGRPYYGEATLSLRPHVRTVAVTFGDIDPFSLAAVECYENALLCAQANGQTVRGLFLCSPHNPLGRCYPREVLCALVALCAKHQIHLISDEVYALSVWREQQHFTSVLSLSLEGIIDPALVHVLWGISKDLGANGWRLGCIISTSNSSLRAAVKGVAVYSYPSSITDHVVAQMLEDHEFTSRYLAENVRKLASAYGLATDLLRQHGIQFATDTTAALFIWADLVQAYRSRNSHMKETDDRVVVHKVREALHREKVYLAWGGNFDSEVEGMFRITFAHPADYMAEGVKRIVSALQDPDSRKRVHCNGAIT